MSITDEELAEWRKRAGLGWGLPAADTFRLITELSQPRAQAAWRPDREEIERIITAEICLIDALGQICVDGDSIRRAARKIAALPLPPQNPRKDGEAE